MSNIELPADLKSRILREVGERPATTRPAEDPDAVLHNPDMGWVVYENFPVDPDERGSSNMLALPNENFDGVCERIAEAIRGLTPTRNASRSDLPLSGGGKQRETT